MVKSEKKLGITLSYDFIPPTLCNDLIKTLDESEAFTHVFIPEVWGRDAFTQIASMANYSKHLVYGTGIVNLYSRSPATLAMTAANLNELTNQQFILGLGLSGPVVIQDWHGINYYKPSPLQRTREYLEILRLIFSGKRVNYEGKIFSLKRFKLRGFEIPLNIPLFLAAIGPKNISLAGELADGWMPIWTSFPEFPETKKSLEKGKNRRNSNINPEILITPYIITCASDSEKARRLVQRHLSYYIGGMGSFYYNNMIRFGFESEAKKIKLAWRKGEREIAAQAVSQRMLDRIAVLGTPVEVIERYQELRKMGVNLPVVMPPYNCPPDLALETINAFEDE